MSNTNNSIISKTIDSLKKHFFEVKFCENKTEALDIIVNTINTDSTIGYGGSKTLEEIGFFEKFITQNYPNLIDRKNSNITPELKKELQNKALTADYFLCSANAVSQSGELILIDKWGNRNAAMTYGPKKRIFVIGKNKIETNLEKALDRAKNTASVLNNKRFDTKNPCTKSNKCMDCESTERLCSITTIIHRCQPLESILIILVNENLGF
jgi:L-lactate utilization protein LutB